MDGQDIQDKRQVSVAAKTTFVLFILRTLFIHA
jgi:hypothetical protein